MAVFGQFDSRFGPISASLDSHGRLRRLVFLDGDSPDKAPSAGEMRDDGALAPLAGQLDEFFQGLRRTFDLPLAPIGTPFQQQVWAALQAIPFGETRSYGELANSLGLPSGAARAVGRANGSNPIALIIPCHRVIGANGALTGYAGGLALKQRLLEFEFNWADDGLFRQP
ncbi:methylated-DNA--[protein]-cysteine S-methyltransferase [Chitinimonas sp.]|uniref:methylated-DNA--[protein]-cysteine S-methyltransferase n=1 Tax=Chitinimonas sp. TaxID=1934313 RepID=UPI0035B06EB4